MWANNRVAVRFGASTRKYMDIKMNRQKNISDKNLHWPFEEVGDRPLLDNLDHLSEEEGLAILNVFTEVDPHVPSCDDDAFFQLFDVIQEKKTSKRRRPLR